MHKRILQLISNRRKYCHIHAICVYFVHCYPNRHSNIIESLQRIATSSKKRLKQSRASAKKRITASSKKRTQRGMNNAVALALQSLGNDL